MKKAKVASVLLSLSLMATLLVTLCPVAVSAQECQEQVSDGGFSQGAQHIRYWWVHYPGGGNITHQWIPDGESHPHVFWYQRYGASPCVKGAVWAWQGRHTEFGVWPRKPPLSDWQDIEVSDYSALSLELDVKVISYSSNGSGEEFPCQVRLDYKDEYDQSHTWNHGFLTEDDPDRTNYTRVPPGEWYPYGPVNLIDVINNPPPARITRITVGGNGCNFEAMIDNVSLCGISETADGCLTMAKFKIDKAKLDFKKSPENGKVSVKGKLALDGNGVDISDDVIVTVDSLSQTITMVEKKDKWEYKRPKGVVGSIKEMKIDWKKGTFEIKMDNADLTGITNPVTIGIQIGDCCGHETILMNEKKYHWDYK